MSKKITVKRGKNSEREGGKRKRERKGKRDRERKGEERDKREREGGERKKDAVDRRQQAKNTHFVELNGSEFLELLQTFRSETTSHDFFSQ